MIASALHTIYGQMPESEKTTFLKMVGAEVKQNKTKLKSTKKDLEYQGEYERYRKLLAPKFH